MLDQEVKAKAVELALLKAKAGAMGNLRAVKQYDLMLKQFMLANDLDTDPSMGTVRLPAYADAAMKKTARQRQALLDKYKVPAWFRTGYDARVRAQLWIRLSRRYQNFLLEQNKLGNLPLYAPAPSYWAKHIRPSDFFVKTPPQQIEEAVVATVAQGSPDLLATKPVQVEQAAEIVADAVVEAEDKIVEIADLQSELAAESVEEEALVETLEQPGEGMLRSEEPWYEDKGKLLFAFAGGLLLISALKD